MVIDVNQKEYQEALERVSRSEAFMFYLDTLYEQELLALINADESVMRKKQGRVSMLKDILGLFKKYRK